MEKDVIVISNDEDEPKDVKSLIKAHVKVTVDASDAIVISDDETQQPNQPVPQQPNQPVPQQPNQPVPALPAVPVSNKTAKKVKYQLIKRDHNYSYYLCAETFEMQSLSHTSNLHIPRICSNVIFMLRPLNPAMDSSNMSAATYI